MTQYLTVRAIADQLGVTAHTVLGWIARGELAACNVGRTPSAGRPSWRVSREALDRFLASRQPIPPPPSRRRPKRDPDVIAFF